MAALLAQPAAALLEHVPENCWCGGFGARAAALWQGVYLVGGIGGGSNMTGPYGSAQRCPSYGLERNNRVLLRRQTTRGRSWEAKQSPSWSAREGFAVVAGTSRLWVIAGRDSSGLLADVWSTQNHGTSWTSSSSSGAFGARERHCALEFQGALLVLGGHSGSAMLQDVWTSTDGSAWTAATLSAFWSARREFGAAVHDGKAYLLGGYDYQDTALADVWTSTDGATWQLQTASAPWGPSIAPGVASFGQRLWLFGGAKVLPTATWKSRPYQQRWAPRKSVVEVSYASKRIALSDLTLSGGNNLVVQVSAVKPGGLAGMNGVKVGDRLVSVASNHQDPDYLQFKTYPAGGLASAPPGSLVLGFTDPRSDDPSLGGVVISQSYEADEKMAYGVDVWSSTDGQAWVLEAEHQFRGLPYCQDTFAVVTAEAGPTGQERQLVVLSGATGDRVYQTLPIGIGAPTPTSHS
ncbi:unnamed protein product [Polarella glacialis]|nr:unnamed protein product [Polarella glacialis]